MSDFNISEALQEAIIGYYSNSLLQDQADELLVWLEKSEENKKIFYEFHKIWSLTGSLCKEDFNTEQALAATRKKILERDFRKLPGRLIRVPLHRICKLAAGIVILAALGVLASLIFRSKSPTIEEEIYFEIFTPKGSKSFILMPDGSSIWLNADTRMRYSNDFGNSAREVYLEGEAFFQVEEKTDLPFKVITSDITITALGTSFNVKSYMEEGTVETTVETGLIQIEPVKTVQGYDRIETITLNSKQSAVYVKDVNGAESENSSENHISNINTPDKSSSDESAELQKINTVQVIEIPDTKLNTSWKDTKWIIRNEKLQDLAVKLERRYDVQIIFMSTDLEDFTITATLLEEPLEQVLQTLSLSTPVRFEVKCRNVYLYEDPELKKQYERILNP